MRQALLKTGIVLFCLWHMFAVGITAVPRSAKDAFSEATRMLLLPRVTWYVQTTSQWQLWDLFAPDPLRLVTLYRIEKHMENGDWEEVTTIKPGSYAFPRHATFFKYLISTMNSDYPPVARAKERFLELQCEAYGLPPRTEVRMVLYTVVLPWNMSPVSRAFWKAWVPSLQQQIVSGTLCPLPPTL